MTPALRELRDAPAIVGQRVIDARAAADSASAALIALEIEVTLLHANRDTTTWAAGHLAIVVDSECRVAEVYCGGEHGSAVRAGVPDARQRARLARIDSQRARRRR